jgi:hypothetical protein
MELAVIILFALPCSTAMSILAFMIGRCARKLPIDEMLPFVVHSTRFSLETDRLATPRAGTGKTQLAPCRLNVMSPATPSCRCSAPQNIKLCANTDVTGIYPESIQIGGYLKSSADNAW